MRNIVLAGIFLLAFLTGCVDLERSPTSGYVGGEAAVSAVCEEWAQARETGSGEQLRPLLSTELRETYPAEIDWMHEYAYEQFLLREHRVHSVAAGDLDSSTLAWGNITYWMQHPQTLLLYCVNEQLMLKLEDHTWKVCDVNWDSTFLLNSYMDFTRRTGQCPEDGSLPEYTAEDLERMEARRTGVSGLGPADAAVTALHLAGGAVIPTDDASEVWYHWEDGDIFVTMRQPEGSSLWVPNSVNESPLNGFAFLEAQGLIGAGLPGGWSVTDELPLGQYFLCGVSSPEGEPACSLAVDWYTGEIFYYDSGTLRPYHEAPIAEVLAQRSSWESEFYRYGEDDRRTVFHKTGEHTFSYLFPDGESGNGRFSGNQGWSDDGKRLFVWGADGCTLDCYDRAEDGRLLQETLEQLLSDLHHERTMERWEENHDPANKTTGITASEAAELLEGALPDGYTVTECPSLRGWYRFEISGGTEAPCILAVNENSAEFRAYDAKRGGLLDYSESPVYPVIAGRCTWAGSFGMEGSPGETFFQRIGEKSLFYGTNEFYHAQIAANQAFAEQGRWMYLWDGDTGHVRSFELDETGAVVRTDGSWFEWLLPAEELWPEENAG